VPSGKNTRKRAENGLARPEKVDGVKMPAKKTGKRWVKGVTTVSTYPKKGIFTKDAETIARHMASKRSA
jgi:hypothetical protein